MDVAFADWGSFLHACRGKDGEDLWPPIRLGNRAFFSSPVAGNVDLDADVEIVIGSLDRFVFVVNGKTGKVERRIGVDAEVWGTALLEDIDGDGVSDIIIGSDDGKLHAIPGLGPAAR